MGSSPIGIPLGTSVSEHWVLTGIFTDEFSMVFGFHLLKGKEWFWDFKDKVYHSLCRCVSLCYMACFWLVPTGLV